MTQQASRGPGTHSKMAPGHLGLEIICKKPGCRWLMVILSWLLYLSIFTGSKLKTAQLFLNCEAVGLKVLDCSQQVPVSKTYRIETYFCSLYESLSQYKIRTLSYALMGLVVMIIITANLYSTTLREIYQRHNQPNTVKSQSINHLGKSIIWEKEAKRGDGD